MKKNHAAACLILLLPIFFLSTPLFAIDDYQLPSGEWRQISLPLEPVSPNNTVAAIFADDIPEVDGSAAEYGEHWVVYSYNSAGGRYKREEPGDPLRQGVGYWITQITGSVDPAQLDMPEDSVAGSDPFSIPLAAPTGEGSVRWNMVGHPLTVPIEFSDYRIKTSSEPCSGQGCGSTQENDIFHHEIWRYDENTYVKLSGDDQLNPWDGFWGAAMAGSTGKDPQLFISSSASLPPVAGKWMLSFEDEFEGNLLDHTKWRVGAHHLGIAGNAGNSTEQISVSGGELKLLAENKPVTFTKAEDGQLLVWDFDYSTGEISTFQKFRQKHGYFEARIKYDVTQGVWPAFWTMPDRGNYGQENQAHESFLRFDLSNYTEPVDSVILRVTVTSFTPDPNPQNKVVDITVHKLLNDDWDEGTINWENKPAYDPAWLHQFIWRRPDTSASQASSESISQEEDPGYTEAEYNQAQLDSNKGTLYPQEPSMQEVVGVSSAESFSGAGEVPVGQVVEIDVTDYINSQINGDKIAGFALVDTFMRVHQISFGSKNATEEADKPQLVINNGETVSLEPTDDAYVRAGVHKTNNYGTKPELIAKDPWGKTSLTTEGGMEIDIMESLGVWRNNTQHGTHWNGYGTNHQHVNSGEIALSDSGYHTYGMSWQDDRIDFYIDGVKSGWSFPPDGNNTSPGEIASYILLSHQLGGWRDSGNIIPPEFQSATMLVDYVRVWSGSPSP